MLFGNGESLGPQNLPRVFSLGLLLVNHEAMRKR